MKGRKEHRVPLAPRTVEILYEMAEIQLNEFVFFGTKQGRPLSNMALLMLLRDLRPGVTVHGFRSAFKDWASEATSFPDYLSEAALAHASADKVRAAYARSDLFEKRRRLMDAWAQHCQRKAASAEVVPLQRRVLCHEYRRSTRRCATVLEMKEGPSGSAIRSLIPSHRELLRSKAVVVSVAETSGR